MGTQTLLRLARVSTTFCPQSLDIAEAYWQIPIQRHDAIEILTKQTFDIVKKTFEEEATRSVAEKRAKTAAKFPHGSGMGDTDIQRRIGYIEAKGLEQLTRQLNSDQELNGAVVFVLQNACGPQVKLLHDLFREDEIEALQEEMNLLERFGVAGSWTKKMQRCWGEWYYAGFALVVTCEGKGAKGNWQVRALN